MRLFNLIFLLLFFISSCSVPKIALTRAPSGQDNCAEMIVRATPIDPIKLVSQAIFYAPRIVKVAELKVYSNIVTSPQQKSRLYELLDRSDLERLTTNVNRIHPHRGYTAGDLPIERIEASINQFRGLAIRTDYDILRAFILLKGEFTDLPPFKPVDFADAKRMLGNIGMIVEDDPDYIKFTQDLGNAIDAALEENWDSLKKINRMKADEADEKDRLSAELIRSLSESLYRNLLEADQVWYSTPLEMDSELLKAALSTDTRGEKNIPIWDVESLDRAQYFVMAFFKAGSFY